MRVRALMEDLARGLLDLVLAPVCVACGEPIPTRLDDRMVCRTCWSRTRPLPHPRCPRCWSPLPPGVAGLPIPGCTLCPLLPPWLRAVRSAFVHQEPVRTLIHALKYGGWTGLAAPLAARMAALPLPMEAEEEVAVVVPVPLGAARLRQRGYNQAALLAEAVAARRGWACRPELLRRTRASGSQTALHPAERRANVAGAFEAVAALAPSFRGQHLLLVDDVWTTGATALACGEALIAEGARALSVLTLARALPELDR